ncbi:MAG TPA: DUF992 domain-containing protein [Reyranella sp.]|nr:DUF992 domain-containing protein [Reyranella sp.]
MSKLSSAALAAMLASIVGGCQTGPQSAQQMNRQYADSKVYIGALTCEVSGSTGFVLGSTKDLDCVYLTKEGVSQGYTGTIRKFGLDLGYTKQGHMLWHVFQLGGLVGGTLSTDPKVLASGFIGEEASVSAGASGGGNWLYGGANNQIVLQATAIAGSGAGYNLAYGIANIELKLKR